MDMRRGLLCAAVLLAISAVPALSVRETKYYDILGVAADADEATIKKAYRRQALRYHPDRNPDKPDAEEKFREIAAAYEVLIDTEKRQIYDRYGEKGLENNGQGGGHTGGGHAFHFQHGDPFNIFETVFGNMGGGGGGGGQRMHFQFGGGGGRGGHHHHHQQQQHQQQRQGGGESLYANDALIQELDEDTFPEGDGEGWVWLVELYAPWCGHCRQLAPKWRKVAEALHGVVRVAAVNCDAQQALCQGQRIKGYPTIRAFKAGRWIEYKGDRSAGAIKDWALALLPTDVIRTVSKAAHLEEFLKISGGGGGGAAKGASSARWGAGMLLFTSKAETSALYKSLAMRYKGKLAFGEVRSAHAELSKRFGVTTYPTLLAVCGGDEKATVVYTDEMKNSKLTKFLNSFYGGKKCAEAIKLDATTDFSKLRVGQLKQLLQAKGVACDNCLEKGDYVKKLQEVVAVGAESGEKASPRNEL